MEKCRSPDLQIAGLGHPPIMHDMLIHACEYEQVRRHPRESDHIDPSAYFTPARPTTPFGSYWYIH